VIEPVTTVRCLGVTFDSDMSFTNHVTKTVSLCFGTLRQLRSLRRCVTKPLLTKLAVALVLSRLDNGIVLLAGLPQNSLKRLQSVLNASARFVLKLPFRSRLSPSIRELGWLPVTARIDARLAAIAYRCINGCAPEYLSSQITRASDVPGRSHLRSASSSYLHVPHVRLKTLSRRLFSAVTPRVWNALPVHVTDQSSFRLFKAAVKKHFIDCK